MNLTVRPRVNLSEFATLENVAFRDDEILPPQQMTIQLSSNGCFSNCVKNINQAESIVAIFAKTLAFIILAVSLVGIPLIVLWKQETGRLEEDATREVDAAERVLTTAIQQWNKRAEIAQALNINITQLPVLNLENKLGNTQYVDQLLLDDLSSPIMKGIDQFGRPVLALKVKGKGEDTKEQAFAIAFFQRYTDGSTWQIGSTEGSNNLLTREYTAANNDNASFENPRFLQMVAQIIGGTHPNLALVH